MMCFPGRQVPPPGDTKALAPSPQHRTPGENLRLQSLWFNSLRATVVTSVFLDYFPFCHAKMVTVSWVPKTSRSTVICKDSQEALGHGAKDRARLQGVAI